MRFWKKKSRQSEVEAIFRKMAAAAFPGGETQIALEAGAVVSLLNGGASQEDARDFLVHAKGRALIAARSAKNGDEALQLCIDSVLRRSQGKLSRAMAEKVALYAFQRLINQQDTPSLRESPMNWEEMTKEESLEVSRITAYRLARHRGRTDADTQKLYNMDPRGYILAYVVPLLTRDTSGARKEIRTERDALELSLDVACSLVLAHYAETYGKGSKPGPDELGRLAQEELDRTLDLVRNKEAVKRHSDYDISEARAAHELQVPFDIALTLGEIGLLRDSPGPTEARRKIFTEVLIQLRNS